MLKQRIITATLLATLVVLAVFELPSIYFSLLIAVIVLIGANEWLNITKVTNFKMRGVFFVSLIGAMLFIHLWTYLLEAMAPLMDYLAEKFKFVMEDIRNQSGLLEWLALPAVFFWVLTMMVIRNSPEGVLQLELSPFKQAFIGWFVLLMSWMFLSRLRAFFGSEMTMYFLLLIWVADIAAFFVGKKWGKTKLSPEISPGKTVEGMYGALGSAIVCGIALSLIDGFEQPMIIADFILLSVLTVLISVYGDLFFSVVKRRADVKDSGSLLPGHGGILDRIDSLCAAIPLFYAGIYLESVGLFS
ncbi:MAG: phosphatidate cytidylyltransferase [Methylococcaceae bacterium]|nr:phosphatidate cytidylyltransferase [Methylococcaceae bacterium]